MTGFEGYCKVTRYGGSWSPNGQIRKMGIREMVNWMNKNGYKLAWKKHLPDGRINIGRRDARPSTGYSTTRRDGPTKRPDIGRRCPEHPDIVARARPLGKGWTNNEHEGKAGDP